jgi:hypothetical protein
MDLRYPIGRFSPPDPVTDEQIAAWIDDLEQLPAEFRTEVESCSEEQLETPYRPGGWTVRQVAHHVADSHLHSVIRFKWALTEDRPTIKPYFEDRWAELPDYRTVPVGHSLDLLEALHRRWGGLLRAMGPEHWSREFLHPESGPVRLRWNVGLYAWHGRHHLAHVRLVTRSDR